MARTDEKWMARALELARCGKGLTAPNPAVGALLVRGGRVIGEGWHRRAGGPHAEVAAVRDAHRKGHRVAGSTIYITLEPCSTTGRTPPCTDLILREKIGTVVAGAVDPNPAHAGRGLTLLRKAGVTVRKGVLGAECEELNRDWNHFITTGRPWVVAKMALSLDGRTVAPEPGEPWVTGPEAREAGHVLRLEAGAIITGGATVREDNPRLTIRLPRRHERAAVARAKQQPLRIVMTRGGKLPPKAHLFTDEHKDRTCVLRNAKWPEMLAELGSAGCANVLLEGGGRLLGAALEADVVNEVVFFLAPSLIGSGPAAVEARLGPRRVALGPLSVTPVGPDLMVRARVVSHSG